MLYEDNYLAHFGIKGQKWGIRRFQDENGILTEEGRRRYGYTDTGTGGKAYRKESKKLDKLSKKADQGYQFRKASMESDKAKSNLKRAAIDVGLLGGNRLLSKAYGGAMSDYVGKNSLFGYKPSLKEIQSTLNWTDRGVADANKLAERVNQYGFGGLAAARLAAAGVHGVKAARALSLASEEGHAKAVAKREAQFEKMQKMFADTPYSELLKKEASDKKLETNDEKSIEEERSEWESELKKKQEYEEKVFGEKIQLNPELEKKVNADLSDDVWNMPYEERLAFQKKQLDDLMSLKKGKERDDALTEYMRLHSNQNDYAALVERMFEKSGNLFSNDTVTEANRDAKNEYWDIRRKGKALDDQLYKEASRSTLNLDKRSKLHQDLVLNSKEVFDNSRREQASFEKYCEVVLKDMGMPVNEKTMTYIKGVIIWD